MNQKSELIETDVAYLRAQKICILRRNGQYWLGGAGWSEKIELAKCFPADQMESKARIDIGMPCEMIYIAPRIIAEMPILIVGELKVKGK